MIAYLLNKIMDWALDKNGRGVYEGEDSKKWAYTIRGVDGSDYLSRLLLPRIRIPFTSISFRPMLHHFHRPDDDRSTHDHPWNWGASVVLCGAYDEDRLAGDPRRDRYMTPIGQCQLCAGWRGECQGHDADFDSKTVRFFNFLTSKDYHKVTRLHGDTWTLFVAGSKKPDDAWGFLDEDGRHIDHETFLAERRREYLESQRVADDIFPKKIGTANIETSPATITSSEYGIDWDKFFDQDDRESK